MKVAVIGAGLTGLSAAGLLKDKVSLSLFEQKTTPGGLCSTVKKNGYRFDYTGHFLHFKTEEVKEKVKSLFKDEELLQKKRKSGVFFKGQTLPYPFQSHIRYLPEKERKECLVGFLKKLKEDEGERDENFYEWMLSRFGEGITKHFMLPYNRKLWTVHPRDMTTSWMGRFVPRPEPEEVIAGALTKGEGPQGYNATYYYPRLGIGELPKKLAGGIEEIKYGCRVEKVLPGEKILVAEGKEYSYDVIINTSPLKSFILDILSCGEDIKKAGGELDHSSLLNINLGWKGDTGPRVEKGTHWLYFPGEEYDFYRVGFPSNISDGVAPKGHSSCYVEISCRPEKLDSLAASGDTVSRTVKSLKEAGIIPSGAQIDTRVILPIKYSYVLYDRRRDKAVGKIVSFLEENSVYTGGRYGGWEYSTMEEALMAGEEMAGRCIQR